MLANALVQLQAHYHHGGEAASEKCLSAATFVRPPASRSELAGEKSTGDLGIKSPLLPIIGHGGIDPPT
jgi:hypothetical protein